MPLFSISVPPTASPQRGTAQVKRVPPPKANNALFQVKPAQPINYTNPVAAKIQQRRYQMLVHAYRYYELDSPVIEDSTWDRWAKELYSLQKENPEIAAKVKFAKEFSSFDPSTGFNLPYNTPEIKQIVERLMKNE